MKYYVDGKRIIKKKAEKIERENQWIFRGVDNTISRIPAWGRRYP